MAQNGKKETSKEKNGKRLVIVESPAKARTINKYLGSRYVVRASMGHVRDLPASKFGVDLENRFEPTYRILPTRKKVMAELKQQAESADEIYLATDLDREGEAIAWHLAEALGISEEKARRVIFNQITKQAIKEAFEHPHKIDLDKVNAQQARRILDRIVGYQLSPLLWQKIAKKLSAGRVQSVAVRLITEREQEIERFVPEEYWSLEAILHAGPQPEEAVAAYKAYLDQCRAKSSDAIRPPASGEPPAEKPNGFAVGDILLHPHSRQPFDVVDVRDPSLITIRSRFNVECQIGKHAVEKNGPAPATAQEPFDPTLQFLKHDSKKQREIFAKHRLFKADLVELDGKSFQESDARRIHAILAALKTAPYQIASIQKKQRLEKAPAPFTTATVQQQAATRLKFTTERTMKTAQQLYEGVDLGDQGSVGLITYMRTDSTRLAPEALTAVRQFIDAAFGPDYLPEKPNFYSSAKSAQEAHEAIRPTDVNLRPEEIRPYLTADQFKLYNLIWRRFVACQMAPARWDVTDVIVTAATPETEPGGGHVAKFKAIGRMLAFAGFLKVLPERLEDTDALLPDNLAENHQLALADLTGDQHFTQPPPRYNEASLVRALEAQGIGRPSTYASIISTIQDRNYVKKEDARFFPTDLGKVVTHRLIEHFPRIMDIKFTRHMEEQLDKIEEAHLDWISVLNEFYEPFKQSLEQARSNMEKQTLESEYTCSQCGKPMVYRWTKNGRFLACRGYPDCTNAMSVDDDGRPKNKKLTITDHACPKCEKPMVLRQSRFGPFLGCSAYPECRTTIPCDESGNPLPRVKPDQVNVNCPECGKPMVAKRFRGRAFLACTGYPQCKTTQNMPRDIAIEWPERKVETTDVKCDKCGSPMVVRYSRRGPFLGCGAYPKCRNIVKMPKTIDKTKAAK